MIKAVIFDLDGTLAESFEGYFHAFNKALKASNLSQMSREDLAKYYGQVDTEILRRFLDKPDVDEAVENATKIKRDVFAKEGGKYITPLPGAVEIVNALFKRKIPMAIASSGRSAAVRMALGRLGIGGKIKEIVSADDVKNGKPHPELFLKAAEKLNTPPENCIVFEDSIHGVLAARAAGMKCIAVATGSAPRGELEKLRPYLVINSMKEILPKLDGLFED